MAGRVVTDLVQLAISTIGFEFRICAPVVIAVTFLPFYNPVVVVVLLVLWVFGTSRIER
ncbi:MAG: hypothetical protein LUO98_03730 [Methanoregula sp.]|nr:hypothetical protein [Methanoregula sp.]